MQHTAFIPKKTFQHYDSYNMFTESTTKIWKDQLVNDRHCLKWQFLLNFFFEYAFASLTRASIQVMKICILRLGKPQGLYMKQRLKITYKKS